MPMANLCFLLLLLWPVLSSKPAFSESSLKPGFHFDLTHVDATRNLSKFEMLQRGIERDKIRIHNFNKMTMSNFEVRMSIIEQRGSYLMNLSLGTPPVSFSAVFDTGSDLIWTQCKPCLQCFEQPTPMYDPAQSSSFVNATAALCKELTNSSSSNGCEYSSSYEDGSFTEGYLALETLTLGKANQKSSTPYIAFGCGIKNQVKGLTQGAGIVGFNRGPLSLPSQLNIKKFSYCLSPNETGSLAFGSSLTSIDKAMSRVVKTTPLIQNPFNPSYYYLSLQGITVGQKYLHVPSSWFKLNTDGSGGVIIDSGTSITYIIEDAFDVLKPAFTSQTNLPVIEGIGLDLCFELPSHNHSKLEVPDLIFHFEGLDLKLPVENYLVADEDLGIACLAMGAAGGLSVFGSMQYQNMLVLHDLGKKVVSFTPTQCSRLNY